MLIKYFSWPFSYLTSFFPFWIWQWWSWNSFLPVFFSDVFHRWRLFIHWGLCFFPHWAFFFPSLVYIDFSSFGQFFYLSLNMFVSSDAHFHYPLIINSIWIKKESDGILHFLTFFYEEKNHKQSHDPELGHDKKQRERWGWCCISTCWITVEFICVMLFKP